MVVIGGGDTALRETLFLAKICKNVKFIWNSEVEDFLGSDKLESIKLKNNKTEKNSEVKCAGAFIAIGHTPNTSFLKGSGIKLHGPGYIEVNDNVKTNLDGVFAAGDVHDYRYMQAVTAAGAGCMAAMEADSYIENLKHKK